MKIYHEMLKHVKKNGLYKDDRTNTGTSSVFGHQVRFNLADGFPLTTTKFTSMRLITEELLWFLKGETNIKSLTDANVHIWDEWATEDGDLGPVYGKQWRSWVTADGQVVDQISDLIAQIKKTPHSRRLIVSAWNVGDLPDESKSPVENAEDGKMALAPCHTMFQFYVQHGRLSCHLYQRSADIFLGVPFNIASYALLTMMIAQVCDLEVGDFVHTFGDLHIYSNHKEQVDLQLTRKPFPLPTVKLNPEIKNIFDFTMDDIELVGYQSHKGIKAPIAV